MIDEVVSEDVRPAYVGCIWPYQVGLGSSGKSKHILRLVEAKVKLGVYPNLRSLPFAHFCNREYIVMIKVRRRAPLSVLMFRN